MDALVAENIKETYRTGLSVFDAFRSEYGLPSVWPPPVSHVTTFIAYLSLNKKAYRTVTCQQLILDVMHHCCIIQIFLKSFWYIKCWKV